MLDEESRPWTMVHGFYANMGGIAISIPENLPDTQRFVPSRSCGMWFLTFSALHLLVNENKFGLETMPALTEEEIKSRSEANGLAKALVCVQALWFIMTCITRRKYSSADYNFFYYCGAEFLFLQSHSVFLLAYWS